MMALILFSVVLTALLVIVVVLSEWGDHEDADEIDNYQDEYHDDEC